MLESKDGGESCCCLAFFSREIASSFVRHSKVGGEHGGGM